MSGDLFSVLRFSLTIDPDNRDLNSISEELQLLRYFTIDEEYWDNEDYEEEEEEGEYEAEEGEEEEEDEEELEGYGSFKESLSPSPDRIDTPAVKIDGPSPAIYVNNKIDVTPSVGKAAPPVATTTSAAGTTESHTKIPHQKGHLLMLLLKSHIIIEQMHYYPQIPI